MESTKIYIISREWTGSEKSTSEEVARFYDLSMASLMLKALCAREGYKAEVDFDHLDCIWAVQAVWTGGGEAHRYMIAEEYINPDGTIDEWA